MSRKELPLAGLVAAAVAGRITNREGASALHLTPRQFQRLKQRYRLTGAVGLRHQGRGRPSHRRLPAALCAQVQALLRDRYAGFNDTHVTEKLSEQHGLAMSRESVRRLRRAPRPASRGIAGARPSTAAGAPAKPAAGQLVQLDGSPFDWLAGARPRLTLLGAHRRRHLGGRGAALPAHRRSARLHDPAPPDPHLQSACPWRSTATASTILVRTDAHWSSTNSSRAPRARPTSAACCTSSASASSQAHSPQAKGRIERLWETLQDRLVSELRLRGIATCTDANAFLPEFRADLNRRFARPRRPQAVWRSAPRDLALVLSCRYARVVARDNTVRLGPRLIQIPRGPHGRSYARRRVEVRELLDGRGVVLADQTIIATVPSPAADFALVPGRARHRAPSRHAARAPTPHHRPRSARRRAAGPAPPAASLALRL